MGFGYTGGGRNLYFGLLYMAGQQSGDPTPQARRVKTNTLYFYGVQDWPGGMS